MSSTYIQLTSSVEPVSNKIDNLQAIYESLVLQYGFLGGIYIMSLSNNVTLTDSLMVKDIAMIKRQQRRNFIYSNTAMKELRREYSVKAIKHEPNMKAYILSNFAIFSYEDNSEDTDICRKILDKYDIRSRLFYRYENPEYTEFSAEFFLMSNQHPKELEAYVNTIKPELIARLENFHRQVFFSRTVSHLNPLIEMGVVSNKGKRILELLSEGYSRTQIGETLFLTERGVDYHVTKLKILLDAKNNAQLVANAFKYKIIC